MTTPRRQLPSLITLGVSTTPAMTRPLTSVPSTSPRLMLKTGTTLQRSFVAPSDSEAVQGHMTSQEQLSKYEPSSFQAISLARHSGTPRASSYRPWCGHPGVRLPALNAAAPSVWESRRMNIEMVISASMRRRSSRVRPTPRMMLSLSLRIAP